MSSCDEMKMTGILRLPGQLARSPAHLEAVSVGQAHVQQHEVRPFGEALHRFLHREARGVSNPAWAIDAWMSWFVVVSSSTMRTLDFFRCCHPVPAPRSRPLAPRLTWLNRQETR